MSSILNVPRGSSQGFKGLHCTFEIVHQNKDAPEKNRGNRMITLPEGKPLTPVLIIVVICLCENFVFVYSKC